MKADPSGDPARWHERDVDAHALEARAAVVTEAARQVQPLGTSTVSRIRAEVLAQADGRQALLAGRKFRFATRAAIGLALVLICAATADGAGILWRRHLRIVQTLNRPQPPAAAPRDAHRPLHRAAPPDDEGAGETTPETGAVPVPPPASDEPATTPEVRRLGARARASALPAPAAAPPAPVPAPPVVETPLPQPAMPSEAEMVAAALAQLRQEKDPRAALATLDAYARAFPHGVLENEAWRTRLEAVIRLDDRKAALVLLDAMPGLSGELATELLLTRAELRAATGRFGDALADFNQVVEGQGGVGAAGERVLYGRAVCLGHLAEDGRARADLLAYERRFPNGRFAAEVRRLLSQPVSAGRP